MNKKKKDLKRRKGAFFLHFWLVTRMKATSLATGTLTAISISEGGIETRSEP